jgi:predicted N-acetyltransferase YhbS
MFDITTETPEDSGAIEALLDTAFGTGRHAKTSYRFREGVAPDPYLRLVARRGPKLVGTVRCWPVSVGKARSQALLLGPLAVAPRHQSQGIGLSLMVRIVDMAAWQRHKMIFLVGDLDYYRRFGFKPAPVGIVMPGERPERLLVMELEAGALAGVAGIIKPWRGLRRRVGAGRRGSAAVNHDGLENAGSGDTLSPLAAIPI